MGAYSRSPGVGYRQATPSIEVRFSAPPVLRLVTVLVVLLVTLLAAPAAQATAPKLKVMTRNVYLGGNIAGPIPAPNREEFERSASALWAAVNTTDFPARAKLLAREVRQTKPDVIGLQEVALWRRGPDGLKDGSATPSTTIVYDFLTTLRKELGPRYKVAAAQTEADLEAPISDGYDVRLTMRDAVIERVRKGLKVRRRLGKNFKATLAVQTAIGALTSRRGWTGADMALAGRRFRFVNTHLEAFSDPIRLQQAAELVKGPLRKRGRVIFTGDINSDPDDATGADPAAYRALTRAGLNDTWLSVRPRSKGFSCCFKTETIMDAPPAPFDHRVDHVLAKGRVRVTGGEVIGGDPGNRAASGLWPSDHGGAVIALRLR
jgi:endonuclease/exonuclease/phosphatase family metal-dependent hydrolase